MEEKKEKRKKKEILILQIRSHQSHTKGNFESLLNSPHSEKSEDPHPLLCTHLLHGKKAMQSKTGRGKWMTGQENPTQ